MNDAAELGLSVVGLAGAAASTVGTGVVVVQAVRNVPIPRWAGLAVGIGMALAITGSLGAAYVGLGTMGGPIKNWP